MKWKAVWTIALAVGCAQAGSAGERVAAADQSEKRGFLYGAGLIVSEEPYRGYGTRVIPIPVLGYVGERLRVLGPFVSYDVLQAESSRVSLRAAPRFQGFEESDSDFFEGMEDRDSSIDAGLGFNYEQEDWKFEAAAMFDTLGKSDGYQLQQNLAGSSGGVLYSSSHPWHSAIWMTTMLTITTAFVKVSRLIPELRTRVIVR